MLESQEAISEFKDTLDAELSGLAGQLIDHQLKLGVYEGRLSKILAQRRDVSNSATPLWGQLTSMQTQHASSGQRTSLVGLCRIQNLASGSGPDQDLVSPPDSRYPAGFLIFKF